jgi:hypothetical protein
LTVLVLRTAQVWVKPMLTETAFDIPRTGTGIELSVVVPSPSSPWALSPQHLIAPPKRTAQVCREPVLI